jgi:DNA-binding NtrC family response regulator
VARVLGLIKSDLKQKTFTQEQTNLMTQKQQNQQFRFPMTRILVIDDEQEVRQAYKTVLEKLDCQVHTAKDGLEGLDQFIQRIYDVVITDYNLSHLDGLQMLEHFQQIDARVPIIFSSGLADEDVIDEVMQNGAFAFIPKPAKIEQLLINISRAIYQKPAHKSDTTPETQPSATAR